VTSAKAPKKQQRGEIETLPSGSLRVRVYAGIDPLTGNTRWTAGRCRPILQERQLTTR
jgi:integrase